MGNVLPLPRTCREARVVDATVAAGARRVKRKARPAAVKNIVHGADQHGVEEKEVAWPECRVEDGGVRLKVLMTRREAAEFMARLEEQAAAESESRTGEILAAGGGVMSPCEVAWRPRLETIPETY